MTATEAPPTIEPLMPSDSEIDRMKKRDLLTVIASHGLPPIDKATEAQLRPYARSVVHGARTKAAAEAPAHEGEPEPQADEPQIPVPVDTAAVESADVAELEPARPREVIPEITVWERIVMMADYFFKSSLRPKGLTNREDVALVLLTAYDLGIPTSLAIRKIVARDGNLGMMGELMSALILRDGHQLRADVANDRTVARVWGKRDGDDDWTWAEFTIEEAAGAGLCYFDDNGITRARSESNKAMPWELYTADMLYWRALSRLARRHFSDALGGITYTPDELGWAIDVEAADELGDGKKPYGRAGEPEPTMTIGRQRSELGARLAGLPEDLQADIKARWAERRYPPVRDLSAAAIRSVRGWLEAAEEIVKERESTEHIPEAEQVMGQDGDAPGPARSVADDGVEGSAADDHDAHEPSPVEDRQEAGEPDPDAMGVAPGESGTSVRSHATGPEGPDAASPAPDAERDPNKQYCAGCPNPIEDEDEVVIAAADGKAYHESCAPFEEGVSG